ncbi:MAG TPA: YtxH domain-containing protein [Nitrospiraceae bacterium]|nr:YtxH domain-containing protein [Nitrospiraceae bacterium]
MSTKGREAAKLAAIIGGGAVIGAALGILFAPKAGTETRREVARYARRAQVQATRFGRAVKSGVTDMVERSKTLVHKRSDKPVVEAA